jgi:predicted transposase YdaD
LREISQDEQARIQYENEMIFQLDTRSWVHDAREEGREEGITIGEARGISLGEERCLQVMFALNSGAAVKEIADKYGMPVESVEKIKNAMPF